MARRKLGYLPDLPDPRDLDLVSLQLPPGLPKGFSLRAFVPAILDQGSTSLCGAHAIAQAVVTAEAYRGVTLPLPSRLFINWGSCRQHTRTQFNSGTYLRTCAAALHALGAPPESEWEFSTNIIRISRQPPFRAFMRAHGRRGGGYYRLGATGSARSAAIKQSVVAGMPVVFGTPVTEAFLTLKGKALVDIPKPSEAIAGLHAMLVTGYEETPLGTDFEIANSWGTEWGDSGFARFTERKMTSPSTADLWCIRGWEAMRHANV